MNLWADYRDILKPSPVIEDQGVYGGYKWVEFSCDVWIDRRYELQLGLLKEMTAHKDFRQLGLCYDLLSMLNANGVVDGAGTLQSISGDTSALVSMNLTKHTTAPVLRVSPYAQDEIHKLKVTLSLNPEIVILGNSKRTVSSVWHYAHFMHKVYTENPEAVFDSNWALVDHEELLNLSRTHLTLVGSLDFKAQTEVQNWGNVIGVVDKP